MHSELIIHDKAMDKSAWGNENINKCGLGQRDKMSNEATKSSTNPVFNGRVLGLQGQVCLGKRGKSSDNILV